MKVVEAKTVTVSHYLVASSDEEKKNWIAKINQTPRLDKNAVHLAKQSTAFLNQYSFPQIKNPKGKIDQKKKYGEPLHHPG